MHPEIGAEQAYFDHALEQRETARSQLDRGPGLAADPKSAAELRRQLGAVDVDPDEAVAFGRLDDGVDAPLYIGKSVIWDQHDAGEVLVVNWQAPVAAPFYTATPAEPQGLRARRTYRCRANRIIDIDDLVFAGLAEAVAEGRLPDEPIMDDALLDSLAVARSGELTDIVTTIQAAQYAVISQDMHQLLVVQGAPGTGKTVVGLHRVSWLLYNMRDELAPNDVLIVGPNPAFVRYISTVLPALGDQAVVQQPISSLGPRVRGGRTEDVRVRRLKGDERMYEVIRRGLCNRQTIDTGLVSLTVAGRRVTIDGSSIESRAAQLAQYPHNQVYGELRDHTIRLVEAALQRGGVRDMAALDISARGAEGREIDNFLDRGWPNLTPQAFLLDLFSTRRQLERAAAGILTDDEIDLLAVPRDARVGSWEWSADDVPLLDAADSLLNGVRQDYAYIVVDEAQDLSPMQLLSIARRSRTGWMTVLGDLAQGTSPWAQQHWGEVAARLQHHDVPAVMEQLELAYRLPAEVHDLAMRLLPTIGAGMVAPRAVRATDHPVAVTASTRSDLVGDVVSTIRGLLGTGLIGVIAPEEIRPHITHALDVDGLTWSPELRAMAAPIVVLSPEEAKGLEFDNVVVVEPGRIVAGHERGLQALFVALTRCTQRLALVHAEPLPPELGLRPDADLGTDCNESEPAHFGPSPDANGDGSLGHDGGAGDAGTNGATVDERETPEVAAAGNGHLNGTSATVAASAGDHGPELPMVSSGAVEREVARAVAGALVRYVTLCVQPELVPLVIEEMQRWSVSPARGRGD